MNAVANIQVIDSNLDLLWQIDRGGLHFQSVKLEINHPTAQNALRRTAQFDGHLDDPGFPTFDLDAAKVDMPSAG